MNKNTAFPLIEARTERVDMLLALVDGGEELTPELEQELDRALEESEAAILDTAARAHEYKRQVDLLAEWRKNAREKEKRLEERGGWLRARIVRGMEWWAKKQGRKTLAGIPMRVTLVAPRGRLAISDPALDKEHEARGYTEEQIEKSAIPRVLFKPVTVWALQKDMVREYIEGGEKIQGVELVEESSIRIVHAGEKE